MCTCKHSMTHVRVINTGRTTHCSSASSHINAISLPDHINHKHTAAHAAAHTGNSKMKLSKTGLFVHALLLLPLFILQAFLMLIEGALSLPFPCITLMTLPTRVCWASFFVVVCSYESLFFGRRDFHVSHSYYCIHSHAQGQGSRCRHLQTQPTSLRFTGQIQDPISKDGTCCCCSLCCSCLPRGSICCI